MKWKRCHKCDNFVIKMTQMCHDLNHICGKHKNKSDVTNVTSNFKNGIKWYRKIEVAKKMS